VARTVVFSVFVLCSVLAVGAAEKQKIDDQTFLEEGRVVRREAPTPDVAEYVSPSASTAMKVKSGRALGEGYAACSTSDDLYPFDLTTYAVGTAIDLPGSTNYPYDATKRPDGSEVWIADANADEILVVDLASDSVVHQIAVGDYPVSLAFSKDTSFAVAVCRDDTAGVDNVYLIDTGTYAVASSWIGPQDYLGPGNLALDPVSGNFYMVGWYDDFLHEVAADGASVLRTADLGTSLWQLVVDPDGSTIYVTDRATDQVRVIDRATFTETTAVAVGDDPWGIDITPDGSKLYVACEDSSNLWVVDTSTWATSSISLAPADPRDVDISPDGSLAFVAGGDSGSPDSVYVIDVATDTLSTSFPLGASASNVNVVAAANQPIPVQLQRLTVD